METLAYNLVTSQFNKSSDECAEVSFLYGKALLEISKTGDKEYEPSNSILAAKMVKLAQVIFMKQVESSMGSKTEMEEKICSTMLVLAEISIQKKKVGSCIRPTTSLV